MSGPVEGTTSTLSFIVSCSREPQSGATTRVHIQALADDQVPREVSIKPGTFLVRVAVGQGRVMERCSARHIATGREAHFRFGRGLSRFIQDCLLEPLPGRTQL
jgi:hypothetical protein